MVAFARKDPNLSSNQFEPAFHGGTCDGRRHAHQTARGKFAAKRGHDVPLTGERRTLQSVGQGELDRVWSWARTRSRGDRFVRVRVAWRVDFPAFLIVVRACVA
jgi:hypothetical protein